MSRELERRLTALERATSPDRVRYIVSDRPLSDEEWQATKCNGEYSETDAISQVLTEAEWVARFCANGKHRLDCVVFSEPALPAGSVTAT
ncbi:MULTISPECIES: hypothetical protein [unclassified Bosea (in: a-proteobacteria)]|uniref:hypothetical protein n=1 Tax=unclassified Bosea (in: a-proteobacteria) TaxID=2653178 RepID=UPI000F75D909|nr:MULTISPECIES: hypothetical protein [unclassified Bosea (in: a-proteobacteria)]AZO79623.1 hypothetical protein BLM15_19955 [Bosea sp. Tri-49]RXT16132.1 hypothetical protein B5U98_29440 [Bosea sp. Tri-39]RXT39824.1 hypothetical protein B5U99_06485 [Bosea sp. Tri-54]